MRAAASCHAITCALRTYSALLPGAMWMPSTAYHAVTAVEDALQQRGNVLHRLLLLERGGNDHAGIVRIAAQPQHMVKLRLRNGKSEGRLCALRFFNGYNLFRFGGEKG